MFSCRRLLVARFVRPSSFHSILAIAQDSCARHVSQAIDDGCCLRSQSHRFCLISANTRAESTGMDSVCASRDRVRAGRELPV